ncbi:MAG: hypothetical protein QNJ37_24945 [Crocosphaera sp.]|nr:hypothetical protein [Crocosphaera sp.]
MTQTPLELTENPLLLTTKANSTKDKTVAFYTNQIADYLESVISKFHEGKDSSVDCLKIEENLQLLIESFHQPITEDQQSYYDAIVNVAFGTKLILSEVLFGGLLGNQDKLNSKLLMVQNNSQKLKVLAGLLQV